jgi:hypothetical protein
MRHVREVVAFLGGQNDVMLARLHSELESSAEELNFERARKLRNSISLLQSIVDANVRLARADRGDAAIVVQPGVISGSRSVMLVVRGRIWSTTVVDEHVKVDDLAARLEASWKRYHTAGLTDVDHQSLDDTIIVMRWLERAGDAPCIVRLDTAQVVHWHQIGRQILALTDEMLDPLVSDTALDDEVIDQPEQVSAPVEIISLVPILASIGEHVNPST